MRQLMDNVEIPEAAARTIAAGMREVSFADGEHPREKALIDAFAAELPDGVADSVDLSTLASPELKEVFLKSVALVAVADGEVSGPERAVLERYAKGLGADEALLSATIVDVKRFLLSAFSGVTVFRDDVRDIGRDLGLDAAAIDSALAED